MKKSLLSLLMAVFSLIILSTACKNGIAEDDNLHRPDIESTASGIAIRLTPQSDDTLYINIYRQKVTAGGEEPVYDIGIIFPKAQKENDATYFYEDKYVIKGTKYRYYAVYFEEQDGYFKTNWTDDFEAENGLDAGTADADLLYNTSASTLIWDSEEKSMKLEGAPVIPAAIPNFATTFKPALIFSYKKADSDTSVTQAIEISDDKYVDPDTGTIKDNAVFNMLTFLPEELLGKNVSILGIIGQFTEKNTDGDIKRIIWTGNSKILMKDKAKDTTIKTFTVNSDHGNSGFNY